MTTDPTVFFLLFQQEREVRIAEAQRKHKFDQASALRSRHPMASALGRRLGEGLVTAGERLQGIRRERAADPIAVLTDV